MGEIIKLPHHGRWKFIDLDLKLSVSKDIFKNDMNSGVDDDEIDSKYNLPVGTSFNHRKIILLM